MKIIRYSKDVDILMVKVSDEPIAYAEEAERFIVHFSNEGKPVLLEIMDAKAFTMESLNAIQSEDGTSVADGANKSTAPKASTPNDWLSEILPVRSVGVWPEGLSLRREDIYDERI